jgi:hypothetical protein
MPRPLREADIIRACADYRRSQAEIWQLRTNPEQDRAALQAAANDLRRGDPHTRELASYFTAAGRFKGNLSSQLKSRPPGGLRKIIDRLFSA